MAEVITSLGKVRGKIEKDHWDGEFFSFQGIPYAQPPLGPLRFKDPQPPTGWDGVRDATHEPNQCYALDMHVTKQFMGEEDCLYINVYTKSLSKKEDSEKLRPVMVWIHGGGFISGSSSTAIYGPDFLMSQDIVLVSFNYRLGALGFCSMDDPSLEVSGNAGLKDMIMALRWVQKEIRHFNGDPRNVTIFGESAGSAACHYLTLSPLAKGLFHKAILQSGCALNVWARGRPFAKKMAGILGCTSDNERDILAFLQQQPLDQLGPAQIKISDGFQVCKRRTFAPTIERPSATAFLCEEPIKLMREGRYNKVPVLIGYNDREGILYEMMRTSKEDEINFQDNIPYTFDVERDTQLAIDIAMMIRNFYYGTTAPIEANKANLYYMDSDNAFIREIYTTTQSLLETSPYPVYFYRFSLDARLNFLKILLQNREPGAAHADDLGYLFKSALTPYFHPDSVEEMTVKRMVKMWTNFARTGNPTPPDHDDELLEIRWEAAHKEKLNYLEIGENLTMGLNPDKHRMQFWEKIQRMISNASKL